MKLLLLAAAISLTGCSALTKVSDKTSDTIAETINVYCTTMPEEARTLLRNEINSKLEEGNSLYIHCI